jgi:lantibiotic modifying enzyme
MGWVRTEPAQLADIAEAARQAVRWVAAAAIPAPGGATWPETRAPGAPTADDLYGGTAGVLAAFAEARLSGSADFAKAADAAAGRLSYLARAGCGTGAWPAGAQYGEAADIPDISLYTGWSGAVAALRMWAGVSGDRAACRSADALVARICHTVISGRDGRVRDLIEGDAGTLLVLTGSAGRLARRAASVLADRIVADARWIDGQPDWYWGPASRVFKPNFSHGAAGIAFALARASAPLDRPELLDIAAAAGQRLISLGTRPDGTLAVPYSIPPTDEAPLSYGWCHGPTGTMRLFRLLARLQPERGWERAAAACARAVRSSGLPARLYPGFWDNIGQCCGTAGVGEMALDWYAETADPQWLAWAGELAADVMNRRIADTAGVRWSHTEHRAKPPDLEPAVGWMQGAAGIAGWLLRLIRVHAAGAGAAQLTWPDTP